MGETVNVTKKKVAESLILIPLGLMFFYVSAMFLKIAYKILYQYKVLGQFDQEFAFFLKRYLGWEIIFLIPLSMIFLLSSTIDFSLVEKIKVKFLSFIIASVIILTNIISFNSGGGIYSPAAEGLFIFLIFYTFTYIFILFGLTRKNWLPMTLISIGVPLVGLIDVGVGFKRLRVEHSTFGILKVVIGGIIVSAILAIFLVVIITSWRYFI